MIGAVQRTLVRFVGLEMPLKSASALTRPKPVPTTWLKLLRCPWYEPAQLVGVVDLPGEAELAAGRCRRCCRPAGRCRFPSGVDGSFGSQNVSRM